MQIFDFTNYRDYLRAALDAPGAKTRGSRTRLALAAGVQPSYLSQVLKGTAELTPEQADRINGFYGHTPDQSDYLLLLVGHSRAGTPSLRAHLEAQLRKRAEQARALRHRVPNTQKLEPLNRQLFYGSWHYAAVAMALTVPGLRSPEKISQRLGIPQRKVSQVLAFLVRTGLARETGEGFAPGNSWIHLGDDVELAARDHAQWRLKAMQHLESPAPADLHYSSVATLSRADFARVKAVLVDAIEKSRAVIKPSPEETVVSLLVDFFEL